MDVRIDERDDYDDRPVEDLQELEEIRQLRAGLGWSAWKAHPRFKKDRWIREAERRFTDGPDDGGRR